MDLRLLLPRGLRHHLWARKHKHERVPDDIRKEESVQIDTCSAGGQCQIGYRTYAYNSVLTDVTIGRFCSIGQRCSIGARAHPTHLVSTHPSTYADEKFRKRTIIGNDVWIGDSVVVLSGVTIGDGAVIGANAVVTKDIPPYAVAVGIPARVQRYRATEAQIHRLLALRWWEHKDALIEGLGNLAIDDAVDEMERRLMSSGKARRAA